jgi:hypothetical protein
MENIVAYGSGATAMFTATTILYLPRTMLMRSIKIIFVSLFPTRRSNLYSQLGIGWKWHETQTRRVDYQSRHLLTPYARLGSSSD